MLKFRSSTNLGNCCISRLFVLYKQTADTIYLNELYDRCYPTIKEEQAPTRQKIYKRQIKKNLISIDK